MWNFYFDRKMVKIIDGTDCRTHDYFLSDL